MSALPNKDVVALAYAASCNPPRRAKRARTHSTSIPHATTNISPVLSTARQTNNASSTNLTSTSTTIVPPVAARAMSILSDASSSPPDYDPDFEPAGPGVTATATPPTAITLVPANQPKRRGRKPSTLSRAARESARRQNHSRIEKARRTKINDALAALRELVPSSVSVAREKDEEEDEEEDEEDDYVDDGKGNKKVRASKAGKEKEFKLEVLEKTVVYVKELQQRVVELEKLTMAGPSSVSPSKSKHLPSRSSQKRKRDMEDFEENAEDAQVASVSKPELTVDVLPGPPTQSRRPSIATSQASGCSRTSSSLSPRLLPTTTAISASLNITHLPSISSLLPASRRSPNTFSSSSNNDYNNDRQLLTPPQSTELPPSIAPHIPPTLSLDLPPPSSFVQSFASLTSPIQSSHGRSSITNVGGAVTAPTSSSSYSVATRSPPSPWTPEDESAASLLLHIRRGKGTSSTNGGGAADDTSTGNGKSVPRVQTPSSLLGMKLADTRRR